MPPDFYKPLTMPEITDDIISELISETEQTPLAQFDDKIFNYTQSLFKSVDLKKKIVDDAIQAKDYANVKYFLNTMSTVAVDILSEKIRPPEKILLKTQLDKIANEFGATIVGHNEILNAPLIRFEKISLIMKDAQKSDFWEITEQDFLCAPYVNIDSSSGSYIISKVCLPTSSGKGSSRHPYSDADKFIRFSSGDSATLSNGEPIYTIVKHVYTYLTTVDATKIKSPLASWIGVKCAETQAYTKDYVICARTGKNIDKKHAVLNNGRYYIPSIIKECSKCKSVGPNWVSKNKEIVCGACINE